MSSRARSRSAISRTTRSMLMRQRSLGTTGLLATRTQPLQSSLQPSSAAVQQVARLVAQVAVLLLVVVQRRVVQRLAALPLGLVLPQVVGLLRLAALPLLAAQATASRLVAPKQEPGLLRLKALRALAYRQVQDKARPWREARQVPTVRAFTRPRWVTALRNLAALGFLVTRKTA